MQDEDLDVLLATGGQAARSAFRGADGPGAGRCAGLATAGVAFPHGRSATGLLGGFAGWPRASARLPALAGLGTAAVFGLALGYLSPTTLDYLTGGFDRDGRVLPR